MLNDLLGHQNCAAFMLLNKFDILWQRKSKGKKIRGFKFKAQYFLYIKIVKHADGPTTQTSVTLNCLI